MDRIVINQNDYKVKTCENHTLNSVNMSIGGFLCRMGGKKSYEEFYLCVAMDDSLQKMNSTSPGEA